MTEHPGTPKFDAFEWDTPEDDDPLIVAPEADQPPTPAATSSAVPPLPPASSSASYAMSTSALLPPEPPPMTPSPPVISQPEPIVMPVPAPPTETIVEAPLVTVPAEELTEAPPRTSARRGRRWESDATFVYVVLLALNFGLSPVAANAPIGRYAIMWTVLVVASLWLLFVGKKSLVLTPNFGEMVIGAVWGGVIGAALLLVGAGPLAEASTRIFVGVPEGAVFMIVVFVMVPAETVFFRHLVQQSQAALPTALMATAWAMMLFFPGMQVFEYAFVTLIVGVFITMLNIIYSYVRQRNGVMAAGICQIIVSLSWLLLPRLIA